MRWAKLLVMSLGTVAVSKGASQIPWAGGGEFSMDHKNLPIAIFLFILMASGRVLGTTGNYNVVANQNRFPFV